MRFFDEIMRRGVTGPTPALTAMRAAMGGATVVACDNVTEYYYVLNDQENWIFPRDFPNVAPPFSNFFIESNAPSKMVSREFGTQPYEGAHQWGFWMVAHDLRDLRKENWDKIKQQLELVGPEHTGATMLAESRWLIEILNFFCFLPDDDITAENRSADLHIGTAGKAFMFVRDDGSAFQFDDNYPGEAWVWQKLSPHTDKLEFQLSRLATVLSLGKPPLTDHCREFFRIMLQPCLLALTFSHCKNVITVDEQPPRQQRRAAERAGKPLTVFKTLQIAPIEQALRARGPRGLSGITLRMHIRRGKFRDYRQGRGLFGKHHGMWWWEDALVGNPDKGVVEKDYDVRV